MSYSSVVFMDKCKITPIEFKKLELCLQYFSNLHVSMIHGRKKPRSDCAGQVKIEVWGPSGKYQLSKR